MDNTQNNTFRVFFSWQSDRTDVKKAIQRELDTVAKKLKKEDINLIIDHDTRDRVGTQNIDVEVLQKILNCDIFIADITPVCKILSKNDASIPAKLIPNPNVMYESGYALAHKGLSKMIFLTSLQHGETIAQLPFDINHNTITSIHDLGQLPALSLMIRKIIDIVRNERMSIKNAYDCNVCFRQDERILEQLTLTPQYKKILYVSSTNRRNVQSHDGGRDDGQSAGTKYDEHDHGFGSLEKSPLVMSNLELLMKCAENIQKTSSLLAPPELVNAKVYSEEINHSICPMQIAVCNIGERALENLYLFLKLDNSGTAFVESNKKSMAMRISPPKNNYLIVDENHIQSDMGILNPNMLQNISTIYLNIPSGVEQVTLYWSIQSTTHCQSGQLMIEVKPSYINETHEDDSKKGKIEVLPYIEQK